MSIYFETKGLELMERLCLAIEAQTRFYAEAEQRGIVLAAEQKADLAAVIEIQQRAAQVQERVVGIQEEIRDSRRAD